MDIIFDPQMSFGDMHALDQFASQLCPQLALEVGSWKGLSSWILAKYSGSLTCVDTWKAAPSTPDMLKEAEGRDVYKVFIDNLTALGFMHKIHPVRMPSLQAAEVIRETGTKYDLIFIDADHAYSSVKQDILAWKPMVRPGGILCGHDCEVLWSQLPSRYWALIEHMKEKDCLHDLIRPGHGVHPGVTLAIHEIFDDKVNLLHDSSIWWVQL